MEYSRYLTAVERFFANAELVLKKRGKDYPDSSLSPSYLLIDNARKNYYLMEIAFPPDEPLLEESLLKGVKQNAAAQGKNETALLIAAVLGKDLSAARTHTSDSSVPADFVMKLALVVPDEFAPVFTDFLKEAAIVYDIVPVKEKFTIYFVNSSSFEIIGKTFMDAASADITEPQRTDTEPPAASVSEAPNVPDSVVLSDASEDDEDESSAIGSEAPPTDAENITVPALSEAAVEIAKDYLNDTFFTDDKHGSDMPYASPLKTNSTNPTNPAEQPAEDNIQKYEIPVLDKIAELDKMIAGSKTVFLAALGRHLWSFCAFAPAYLISIVTGKKLPAFIYYWIGGMAVALGAYAYPLSYLSKILKTAVIDDLYRAVSSLNELYRLSGGLPEYIDNWCSALFGTAFAVTMVLAELIKLVNSAFYLQLFLSAGYFIAIIPAWREFGKRMISFFAVFYALFIPFSELAAVACGKFITGTVTSTAPIMGGYNLMGSVGCYILIMISAPAVAAIVSNRACKSKADVV
jgi:hypothetical protein